jgi:GNAT superfamily N-acetyltransferase
MMGETKPFSGFNPPLMTTLTSDQTRLRLPLRAGRAADRAAVRAFLHRLSPSTLRTRYLSPHETVAEPWGERELDRLLDPHDGKHMVVLALDGAEVRGIGEYVEERAGEAELALMVEDRFQGRRVGRALMGSLQQLAHARGICAFYGDVAYGNWRMLALLRGAGGALRTEQNYGSLRFQLRLLGC